MSENEQTSIKPKHRGIYLLPNLFTVSALFAGFYAIVASGKHHFGVAAVAILIGALLDSLDGRIARLTHSQSEFGAQMDSLSDMVCFGVSPALVLYSWSLMSLGKPGWLVAFFYTVCNALRLARFNSQLQTTNKRYFQGLSTTAAACAVASGIWVCDKYGVVGTNIAPWIMVLTIMLGLLMVSTIRYRSFKDIDLRNKVPFLVIFIIVLFFVFVAFDPPDVFFAIAALYVLSGPASTLWLLRQRRKHKRLKSNLPIEEHTEDTESK